MPSRVKKRAKMKRAERRRQVALFYDAGLTQRQIAEQLGCNQSTVARDIDFLINQSLDASRIDFERAKAEFLRKLDRDEAELLKQYRLSSQGRRKDRLTGEMCDVLDTTILARIDALRTQRAKVLALYAVEKAEAERKPEIMVKIDR